MRRLFFIAILVCMDLYIFIALRHLITDSNTLTKWILTTIYWSISLISISYFLAFFIVGTDWLSKSAIVYWRTLAMIGIGAKIPILGILFIDDIRRFITWTINSDSSRLDFLVKTGFILGGIPLISLVYGLIRNPYRYKLYKSKVPIKGLPASLDGLRIVQISDIHSGSFTFKEPIKNAIEIINQQNADVVFFTGDLVNSVAAEMEPYIDVFDKISSKYGVYSILGNHDYGDYHAWKTREQKVANMVLLKDIHKRLGWDLLLNEHRLLNIEGASLGIIGVENISGKLHFKVYGDLSVAHQDCPDCDVKILLSHDPSHWDKEVIKAYKDIDLTLSGHTHGMQFGIEIPGFIKFSPIQFVYKKWAGLYKEGNQYLYVNRGLGFLGYPGRVGILPEITLLELKSA